MTLLKLMPMDMLVIRDLAELYAGNNRTNEAVVLYEDARAHYMSRPHAAFPDGDLQSPFNWYPTVGRN
jgi:hypothetical protein